MSFLQNLSRIFNKSSTFSSPRYHLRAIHKSSSLCSNEVKAENSSTEENYDILEDLREPDLTEEEIMQKRFKSRLPEFVYKKFVKKEGYAPTNKYDFKITRLRSHWARFGKDSYLNPGICWPTRDDLLQTIEEDKVFEPSLEARIKAAEESRLAEEKRKRAVEAEVDKNMANLDKWIAEYHDKIAKKEAEQLALKQKKEKLIDEISEYLGYEIDPKDPRFQEAVEQKQKEQKKALKQKKQQEAYEKMLLKLKQMAEQK